VPDRGVSPGDDYPAQNVSWIDAAPGCGSVAIRNITAKSARIPRIRASRFLLSKTLPESL
jgi:hypothetical protein